MNRTLYILIVASVLAVGCRNPNGAPDVSGIKVNLTIERFDKDLFALDSNNLKEQLPSLFKKYPNFAQDFLQQELNVQPSALPDTVYFELKTFLSQSQYLKDSAFKEFASLDDMRAELEKYFRYVKYYYPDYKVPTIINFIGNFGGRELNTQDGLGIGLNFYLGASFSYYQMPQVQEVFPQYLSRKFSRQYIPVNCMAAVIDDLYPSDTDTLSLIDQIIDRGKRLYVLDKFLPGVDDTMKLGYTANQYTWCKANEGQIWNFFLQQNILYSFDPDIIKNYLTDAPYTQNMPEASPGSIGSFVGQQIIRKYVAGNGGNITPKQMMAIPPKTILSAAQYNPR